MSVFRGVTAFCVLAFGAAGCDGCDREPAAVEHASEDVAPPDPEVTLGLAPEVAERRLALVDDEPVTVLDLARELDTESSMVAARHADFEGRVAVLEALLMEYALAAEARDRGLADDPTVVRAREEVLVRAYVAEIALEVPEPTDEAVRAVFDSHRDRYRAPERRTAGIIFTRDREAALAAIPGLNSDMRQQPQNWMQLAERIGFAGPRIQPREETELFAAFPRPGEAYVPQVVRDAAFETEPGSVHPEPVPFEDGFYVVRTSSLAEPMDLPFEAVEASIRAQLHDEAVDSVVTQQVATSLAEAEYDESALDAVVIPQDPSQAIRPE
jgi:hypothetical protein